MRSVAPALLDSPGGLVEALRIALGNLAWVVHEQARLLHRFTSKHRRFLECYAMIAQAECEPALLGETVQPLDQQRCPSLAAHFYRVWFDDLGEFGIMVASGLEIVGKHVPQHQRIRQPVRKVMQTAERISESVHTSDRRVRKCETC